MTAKIAVHPMLIPAKPHVEVSTAIWKTFRGGKVFPIVIASMRYRPGSAAKKSPTDPDRAPTAKKRK